MKRIHIFEFEDLQWFPGFLRNYMTDFLQFVSNKAKIYVPIVDILVEKLKATNTTHILDIASGGGGGLLWLNTELLKQIPELTITLTDYYPNLHAFEHTISQAKNFNYIPESIDAKDVPEHVKGFRTQFLSLHHFKPKDAQKILQNAVDTTTSIAIFEVQDRSIPSFIGMLLSPINVLLTSPFIKPFKLGRIVFTYIIPILPVVVLWDGIVSCLRTYSVPEMTALVNEVANKEQFDWSIGIKKQKMHKVLYLIGTPKSINEKP
ncbi:MAG: hypothetical protein AAF617_14420 [Bacteroidota bacterium]